MPWVEYGEEDVNRIINRYEGKVRDRFRAIVRKLTEAAPIALIERLIAEGRPYEAIRLVEAAAATLANEITSAYIGSAKDVSKFIDGLVEIAFDFDGSNPRAVAWMRQNRLRFIQEFTDRQRQASREALIRGISEGRNPRAVARDFRGAIGLTRKQVLAAENFRRMLETNSAQALTRGLRDKRFDRTLRQAIVTKRPLTENQIEMMVARYREGLLKQRSEVIARTEALHAVNAGNEAAFQQAIDSGDISLDQLIREWNTAKDERVRGSHKAMHGQKRPWGVPFTSGLGNDLRYPGDELAPAADVIECRCAVGTRVRTSAAVADLVA
jgi:AcrR family transcriptional regulator